MKKLSKCGIIIGIILILIGGGIFFFMKNGGEYYPTDKWKVSTPEKQGMDSRKLVNMLQYLKYNNSDIHSVLVIKNGYLVTESYLYPYNKDKIHKSYSITKSFMSALTGIALDKGVLNSLDQKAAVLLPDYFDSAADDRKREINLRHLLTMKAGMKEDPWIYKEEEDIIKKGIKMPLISNPGEEFVYNNLLSDIMAAILNRESKMNTLEFADKYLFNPLGIEKRYWERRKAGYFDGSEGLYLTSRGIGKLGYLYLKEGRWKDKQIISKDWIEKSTAPQFNKEVDYYDCNFGYWWWVKDDEWYESRGWAGQKLLIKPEDNLVVVITSGEGIKTSNYLVENYILPAVKSKEELKGNPELVEELRKLEKELQEVPQKKISPLPDTAEKISGNNYEFYSNKFNLERLKLNFEGNEECTVELRIHNGSIKATVGLDGVYRINKKGENLIKDFKDASIAFRGRWKDERTFLLSCKALEIPAYNFNLELTFKGNRAYGIFTPIIEDRKLYVRAQKR